MKMLGATVVPVTSGNMTLKGCHQRSHTRLVLPPRRHLLHHRFHRSPHPYPDMVARLQSVISEEIKNSSWKKGDASPDYLIACIGGGSNAAGTIYHYVDDRGTVIVLAEAGGKG